MSSDSSDSNEATDNDESIPQTSPSTTISSPDHSSLDVEPLDSDSFRDRNVASPLSKHHHVLPKGWKCEYDVRSKSYHFSRKESTTTSDSTADRPVSPCHHDNLTTKHEDILPDNDEQATDKSYQCPLGYHFPSSPTPSMLSALAEQVANNTAAKILQSKTKPTSESSANELEMMLRLCKMFPTAPEALVISMTRTYHQREKLIIASLISQGYRRANDRRLPATGAVDPTALIVTRPASKKLFDKLMGYFPGKDEMYIKNLMVKHNEVEHEIISAIVESSSLNESAFAPSTRDAIKQHYDEDKDGVMMKLRYLKFLYPDCDELEIFHLLHSNDMNAQNVMNKIEARGIQKSDIESIMNKRKLLNQQRKTQQAARSAEIQAKDKALLKPLDVTKKPPKPNITNEKLNALREVLKKEFATVHEELIDFALDAANFSEGIARRCLRDMTPDEDYMQCGMIDLDETIDERIYPSKSTQTQVNYKNVVLGSPVRIPRNLFDEQQAVALTKNSIGTWTGDYSFEEDKRKLSEGHNSDLVDGSKYSKIICQR